MTQWVTISSHHEFWKILRALGHDSIEPVDILRIDSGLMLLRGLGLRPTWPNGHAIVERLISESRRLIGGARRVAHQIGATPDNINKIFRKCHLPTLDVACRWATRLVVLARDRGVEPPDVLLRVALGPITSASAPSVGGSVGENADSARGVGESVGATRPAVGESVGATRPAVGESVGAMRPTVGESVGETTDSAQNVGEIVGENADSAHRQPGPEEFEAGRLTGDPIVEHGSLVMTTIEWRYAGGRRMQQECPHQEARSLIDKYYDEWAGAEILINGKPFDDTRIFLTRSFRAMEARLERRLERRLEAMLAGHPQAQGSPQAKTDLKSTLDEVLAPLRDELIGLRQRMETAPSPALRMIASVVLDMMEEDDDG